MGCGGSKPEEPLGPPPTSSASPHASGRAANGTPRGGQEKTPRDSNGKRAVAKVERREGISSGKQGMGSSTPAQSQMQQPSGPKSAADLEQLRKASANLMLFSSMTVPQQEDIFAAMFEVRPRCSRGRARVVMSACRRRVAREARGQCP